MTAAQVVQAGIELLDRDKPDWRASVDVANLDMWTNCIIDQVYGKDSFISTLERLGIRGRAGKFGFNFDAEHNISTKDLVSEWKRRLSN